MRALVFGLALGLAATGAARAAPLVIDSEVLLIRHGVRPPTHEPALPPAIAPDAWPHWPVADGFLTPHGAAAIRLLASYDRSLLAAAGLVPATGCPAGAKIYADVDERTVATGQAYAAGFAPGCALPVGHAAGARDPLFSALDQPDPAFDAKAAQAAMLAPAGGDLAGVIQSHAALFGAMQTALQPGGHAFLDLPSKISAKAPGQIPKLSGPLAEGSSAAEDFLLEYLEGFEMSQVAWGRLTEPQIAALLALHPLAYTITARPAYIAGRAAAPLAARILTGLTGGQKFTLLVGHDTNQAQLAGLLNLHWSLGGYPADDPPPGGGIFFVLSHDPASHVQYVTVTYQAQTMDQIRNLKPLGPSDPPALQNLAIPSCGNSTRATACTLAMFTRLYGAGAPGNGT
jgi:4-phytase/acid phosphatase